MPTFTTTGRLTKAGSNGLMAKPEDRMPALNALAAASDAKILSYYLTTGRTAFVMVTESPSVEQAVAAIMVAMSSGSVTDVETVQAWTSEEYSNIAKNAGSIASNYSAPGS